MPDVPLARVIRPHSIRRPRPIRSIWIPYCWCACGQPPTGQLITLTVDGREIVREPLCYECHARRLECDQPCK